jgi:hypothetical protein
VVGGPAEPRGAPDGPAAGVALPDFVPARFRETIAVAATRWKFSAPLLEGVLMAD